jgi:hypothetical protein
VASGKYIDKEPTGLLISLFIEKAKKHGIGQIKSFNNMRVCRKLYIIKQILV